MIPMDSDSRRFRCVGRFFKASRRPFARGNPSLNRQRIVARALAHMDAVLGLPMFRGVAGGRGEGGRPRSGAVNSRCLSRATIPCHRAPFRRLCLRDWPCTRRLLRAETGRGRRTNGFLETGSDLPAAIARRIKSIRTCIGGPGARCSVEVDQGHIGCSRGADQD